MHRRAEAGSHYAWLLHLLVRQPQFDDEAAAAAVSYIEGHTEEPGTTAPIILALDLAHLSLDDGTSVSEDDRDVALTFLERIHPLMESSLNIETNIEILRFLIRYGDSERHRHAEAMELWEAVRQERDGLTKLPALVEVGKFFLVIWHYYETLSFFGLRAEPQVNVHTLIPTNSHAAVLEEWRAQNEPVPEAMVQRPAGPRLSGDFLRYGRALFGAAAEDPELESARDMFNEAALDALPDLFEHMTSLRSLPERVHTLLDGHRRQLLRAATPG